MKKRTFGFVCVLISAFGLLAQEAKAEGFEGHEVHLQFFNPRDTPSSDLLTASVSSGVEFPDIRSTALPGRTFVDARLDVGDTDILYWINSGSGTLASSTFNGFVLSDALGAIPDIVGVTINAASTHFPGLDASRIDFGEDWLSIDVQSLDYDSSSIIHLDVQFVPEPATVLLLGLGAVRLHVRPRRRA